MKLELFQIIPLILMIGMAINSCGENKSDEKEVPYLRKQGLCAHRGANATHPENTLAAFREAIRIGAHMLEFDVRLTRDGELVILHDTSVDRTTNGSGEVSELTLAEIKTLDAGSWKSSEFAGEKIPTLQEVLDIVPKSIWLNIHLKGGYALGEDVAKVISKQRKTRQAFLACGREAAKGAKAVSSEILICNMERQANSRQYVDETIEMGAEFIQIYKSIPDDLPELTQKLKASGVRINYCCTDDPVIMKKLFEDGVEFVLVNDLATMMAATREMGIQPRKQ